MIRVVLLLVVVWSLPTSAVAQRLAPSHWRENRVELPWESRSNTISPVLAAFGHPDDYRWEGAVTGAFFLGFLGGALGAGFCGYGDGGQRHCFLQTIEGVLIGITIGVTLGGMIGSAIHKPQE